MNFKDRLVEGILENGYFFGVRAPAKEFVCRVFKGVIEYVEGLEAIRLVQSDNMAIQTKEIERLDGFCREFVWGEENPNEYESEMTKKDKKIKGQIEALVDQNRTINRLLDEKEAAKEWLHRQTVKAAKMEIRVAELENAQNEI